MEASRSLELDLQVVLSHSTRVQGPGVGSARGAARDCQAFPSRSMEFMNQFLSVISFDIYTLLVT